MLNRLTIMTQQFYSSVYTQEKWKHTYMQNLCTNVTAAVLIRAKKQDMTHMSSCCDNEGINKSGLSLKLMLFAHKKDWSKDTCYIHHRWTLKTFDWAKDTLHKGHILCDSMDVKWSKQTNIWRKTEIGCCQGLGGGKNEERLILSMKMMKMF